VNEAKECRYDQGGYFIINGSEKVLVAQERMAQNIVLVFQKKQPNKFSWVSEVRSMGDHSGRPPQQFSVKLTAKEKSEKKGQTLCARLPIIREDVPIAILFRALNVCSDKQIQDMMIYDETDTDMMEALRASLEQAGEVRTQE
jgi:DNA-directed RNA polymerase II subunit RPB2